MRISASGGTDGANIVLFWPDQLPDDADQLLKDDPMELIERLAAEGKLLTFPCGGDGHFSVSIYVQSDVPADLFALCTEQQTIPRLIVRGTGYFGGGEYMFKRDRSLLDKYPAMMEEVAIPDGTYGATLWRVDLPSGFYPAWLRQRVGRTAKLLRDTRAWMLGCGICGLLALPISWFFLPRVVWLCLAGATGISIIGAMAISRTAGYQRASKAKKDFATVFPSFVVRLE